ncbi:hypothetical protein IIA15_00335 [candidate division TA06 bacterium]|nr:hypothetical protein [candidate division TA06 bacterium]
MRVKTNLMEYDVLLGDDGTLDTVIVIDGEQEIRFSQEYASTFRQEDGSFTESSFRELAEEAVDIYEEDKAMEEA